MTTKNSRKWQLSIRVSDDVHTWLKQEGKRQRRSMSNVILCMLDEYIEHNKTFSKNAGGV